MKQLTRPFVAILKLTCEPSGKQFNCSMVKLTKICVSEDGAKRKIRCRTEDMNEWVSDLVSRIGYHELSTVTKADRVERRLAKKRRYELIRQQDCHTEDLATSSGSFERKNNRNNRIDTGTKLRTDVHMPEFPNRIGNMSENETNRKSVIRLKLLTEKLEECLLLVREQRNKRQKPFLPAPAPLAKKAQRQRTPPRNSDFFQPRASGYGGIGLARPSLYIPFDDPSWRPKLEEEFVEHVPGFYGKQRTKAMKKQLDGQMLWRQLLKRKEEQVHTKRRIKILRNNVATMTPDEHLEVSLRAGAI